MVARTVNVFYIGNLPTLDTVQGDGTMEGAAALLGHYAHGTDFTYQNLHVQHDPAVVDGLLATNDYGADENNPGGLYDEGFANTPSGGFSELDSQQLFVGDVTYLDTDGTEQVMTGVPFNVYQLENGDTFVVPTGEIDGTTTGDDGQFTASVLSGLDILSFELTGMRDDAIGHDNLLYDWESIHDEVQTFYLGNHNILDTVQGDGYMEDASTLLGSYDGTQGTPGTGEFSLHTLRVRHDPYVNDSLLATNDYGASAPYPDGWYDEGFSNAPTAGEGGTTFSELDSQQLFWGDVYYLDEFGNEQVLQDIALNVYQLENGDVFAVPTREIASGDGSASDADDTSPSVLAGLAITRIDLTSMRDDAIGHDSLLYDSESIGDDRDNTSIICFLRGTMIETQNGAIAVENLSVGDMVMTADSGPQPLRWLGFKRISSKELGKNPGLYPIRFRAGSLGDGLPRRDLRVSPQHRVLVRSRIARRMFQQDEILVAAKQLLCLDGVDVDETPANVDYFHILFDKHQVVFAEGAPLESLYTGKEALKTIRQETIDELFNIFPELASTSPETKIPKPARMLVNGKQGRQLAFRHKKNRKPLIEEDRAGN